MKCEKGNEENEMRTNVKRKLKAKVEKNIHFPAPAPPLTGLAG